MPIPDYKDIMELLKKGVTIEAQEKIMELRVAAMELQEQNLALREKVVALEAQIKKASNLKLKNETHWADGDPVPYCQVCYDKDAKLIHLLGGKDFGREWSCPVCKWLFGRSLNSGGPGSFNMAGY